MSLVPLEDSVTRWAGLLAPAAQLAERIADTEFVPAAMRGKPAVVVAAIMYGDEIGVGPMQALHGIHVVEGRPQPSAELMRALILRAGHTITVHDMTGTRVRVSGLRAGEPESERLVVEWSLDMARAAGLLNKSNWRNYPRAMLLARATADLARAKFPDVIKGLGYIAEDALPDLEGWATEEPLEAEPEQAPRKALQRRRKPRVAPQATEPPPEPVGPGWQPYDPNDVPLPPDAQPTGTGRPQAAWQRPLAPDDLPPVAPPIEGVRHEPQAEQFDPLASAQDDQRERVPLPDLEPEAPQDEPPPAVPAKITPGPLKALHTALSKELGSVATREEKHSMVQAIIGHPIESSKDLTRAEGYEVLVFLDRVKTGDATYVLDPDTGEVSIPSDQ